MSSRYYTKRLVTKRPKKGECQPPKPRSFTSKEKAEAWLKKYGIKGTAEAISEKKWKVRQRA
ncbi:hypothetical protein KY362_02040 [Candidatus Woesearchaeota archaeon]|nr:hypothetical protein [Candidatus Woesearchaeota archaeon]